MNEEVDLTPSFFDQAGAKCTYKARDTSTFYTVMGAKNDISAVKSGCEKNNANFFYQ